MSNAIYVSSSCVNHRKITLSVEELAQAGFRNIELSGGTHWYQGITEDLLELKDKHRLSFRCHNYFPPPREHFVLNLGSSNTDLLKKSIAHVKSALLMSEALGATIFGVHAGFRLDPKPTRLGKVLQRENLVSEDDCKNIFIESYNQVTEFSRALEVELFIENNVFSAANSKSFNQENPFLLTHFKEYQELKDRTNFSLLLDVAHLKVSCKTLGIDFGSELSKMMACSEYLHISDNDGYMDSNKGLSEDSSMYALLEKEDWTGKAITLEVYDGLESLWETHELIERLRGTN